MGLHVWILLALLHKRMLDLIPAFSSDVPFRMESIVPDNVWVSQALSNDKDTFNWNFDHLSFQQANFTQLAYF